jgi:hypothetical protein
LYRQDFAGASAGASRNLAIPAPRTLSAGTINVSCEQRLRFDALAAGRTMYHYDAKTALEELQEDAVLPHPVKLRDMILRVQLGPQEAQLMNAEFQDYLTRFGELQRVARGILEKLATGKAKN